MNLKLYGILVGILCSILPGLIHCQVVQIQPRFPKVTDSLTIVYDASRGSAGLKDCTQIYIHTGLVIAGPTSTAWTNVPTNWGVDQPKAKMTNLGNNLHQIKYIPYHYYNVSPSITAYRLAFVFRNRTGTITGKTEQGQDIFMPLYQPGQQAVSILDPTSDVLLADLNDPVPFLGASSVSGNLKLFVDGTLFTEVSNDTSLTTNLPTNTGGTKKILFQYGNNPLIADSLTLRVNPPVVTEALPTGMEDGINILSPTSAILVLRAPLKKNVYVRGEFNNWQLSDAYYMKKTPDGRQWWVQIDNLDPTKAYAYQYFVDGKITVADPYSRIILDQSNDNSIPTANYPNRKPYPTGKTSGNVSVLQTVENPYAWVNTNFQRPARKDLVVYELLIRDFMNGKNYKNLADTLPYLKKLGINCIELMPVQEFEGNLSWGYNPSHHFALDKYYGRDDFFKAFVDKAHGMGIAIVLDIALNHCFGQSPLAQLYWNSALSRPAADNPWLNEVPKHDFNVGNDFNHESADTRYYVDRVLKEWLQDYKVDGFRFDLSKGFTQKNTLGNTAAWGAYDAARVAIWKGLYDDMQSYSPGCYPILEHFADNSEEKVLADYGLMFWGNLNNAYCEASMGYTSTSDLGWGYYKNRNWNNPNLLTYMESHDEERQVFKNLNYGNVSGTYSIKDTTTALERVKLTSCFFYTIPGPKMLWQFGELGYHFSINRCTNGTINTNCRLDEKPIKWNFLQDSRRLGLYRHHQALIALKRIEPVFSSTQVSLSVGNIAMKRIVLQHATRNAVVLGNFGVAAGNITPNFTGTGTWYEFFTGNTLTVNNVADPVTLQPGEYRIYSNIPWLSPEEYALILEEKQPEVAPNQLLTYPNPASSFCTMQLPYLLDGSGDARLYDSFGREIVAQNLNFQGGVANLQWHDQNLAPGMYQCQIIINQRRFTARILVK